jgi:hypothetical protein
MSSDIYSIYTVFSKKKLTHTSKDELHVNVCPHYTGSPTNYEE